MPSPRPSRLSYANVVATLALFLALCGGAYAAFKLPKNSVRSRNIVNGQVKERDLARGAVTSAKFATSAVAPRAERADHAGSADLAARADQAGHAAQADQAGHAAQSTTAVNAEQVDGHSVTELLAEPHAPSVSRGEDFNPLPGFGESCHAPTEGPSVSVTVGASGLVAVYVSATILLGGSGNNGSVELFESTDFPSCLRILHLDGSESTGEILSSAPGSSTGTASPGGWVVLNATPGARTYTLRMSGDGSMATEHRVLAVMPL